MIVRPTDNSFDIRELPNRRFPLVVTIVLLLAFVICGLRSPAASIDHQVVRQDNSPLSTALGIPVYTWQSKMIAPRAVIVTIHGVTLHGAVFDSLATELAKDGYLVVSPDLRGFGRWRQGDYQNAANSQVSYHRSRADLVRLFAKLDEQYARLPIFCIGESLGANLALWLASTFPDYLDGVIISSTCVKRRLDICSTFFVDLLKAIAKPDRQVPIAPYARRFLSEDPRILAAYLGDPLNRKTMSIYESFQSLHAVRSTLWFIDQIPANMPVLVIEGTKDRMFDPKQITPLLSKLKLNDQKVFWLKGKGHIQLETPHISDPVRSIISTWLAEQSANYDFGTKATPLASEGGFSIIQP